MLAKNLVGLRTTLFCVVGAVVVAYLATAHLIFHTGGAPIISGTQTIAAGGALFTLMGGKSLYEQVKGKRQAKTRAGD